MRSARAFWRSLTSMRTALILLLVLAVVAVPGSIWPQRGVSVENVNGYLRAHQSLGPWLDRFWFFDVYSSPWFSAVYLLLFISLIGCLLPRLRQHAANLIAKPPAAPARLDRLPHVGSVSSVDAPPAAAAVLRDRLRSRRWRTVVRTAEDGEVTVSAEKGYLKESGNLLFHFALLALLTGVALGSWYGWHANRLVVAGEEFCNTAQQYDEYGLGPRVSAADLPGFCVQLDSFEAQYLDNGQPSAYTAQISYVDSPADPAARPWTLRVNDPLRLDGANVYLLGHGYAPVLRFTDRYGTVFHAVAPFLPTDGMLTSDGVFKFQDANVDPNGVAPPDPTEQIGFAGVFVPTAPADISHGVSSVYPAERDPVLTLVGYQGNLGLGTGRPQSVYELDQRQIANGELVDVGRKNLRPGESWTLPDGSTVEFVGTRQWITVSVRHDPGEPIVLFGAGAVLVGLMVSLSGKRRRVWARISPADGGGSLITLGGLARTEYPGFADEFAGVLGLVDPAEPEREPVAAGSPRGPRGQSQRSAAAGVGRQASEASDVVGSEEKGP
jgi:cytochrome c biogenesis protein